MKEASLKRIHLLAAEVFKYSFANYKDKLSIRHLRFSKYMPDDIRLLDQAEKEGWSLERLAEALEVSPEVCQDLVFAFDKAKKVVDAANPAEAFRESVRQAVEFALYEGLESEEAIDDLVVQICYRVSDLDELLQREGRSLRDYSRHLRREKDVG